MAGATVALVLETAISTRTWQEVGWVALAWIGAVALVDLAALPLRPGLQIAFDLPVLLAAGFLYGPAVAGVVAFLGYLDLREFRGEIRLVRGLYNRAQVSLSVMAGVTVFELSGGRVGDWPVVLVAALMAVIVDVLVNYTMVGLVLMTREALSPAEVVRKLQIGELRTRALVYVSFGFFALLLAHVCLVVGVWGLAMLLFPLLLTRHAYEQSTRLEEASREIGRKERVVLSMQEKAVNERRDERLAIAAGLHDEVLPPLYKVHLMGQVLRHDLSTGQLLALEEDVPELVRTVEMAADAMRLVIRNLRDSALGTDGLAGTIRKMTAEAEQETEARILLDLEDVPGSSLALLIAYQVVRESVWNAIRHAAPRSVRVTVREEEGQIRAIVEDDGVGFSQDQVDAGGHFGISLMRERVELAGGAMTIVSSEGRGTTVAARIPVDA